jgi:GR25 family glycosyltransferase involved in LPS biosynthesis
MEGGLAAIVSHHLVNAGQLHVLTLPDASARQARVREWLERAGLSEDVFVQGIDLRGETTAFEAPQAGRIHRQLRYGRDDLTPPEYGCLLGHRRIWERLVDSSADWALVLEDDAKPLRSDWFDAVHHLAHLILRTHWRDRSWVVHLGRTPQAQRTMALRPVRWRSGQAEATGLGLVDPRLGGLWTTLAYAISRKAASRCLEHERSLPWQADDWSERLRLNTVDLLLAADPPIFAGSDDFPSQIEHHCIPVDGPPVDRLQRKALTIIYRLGLWAFYL